MEKINSVEKNILEILNSSSDINSVAMKFIKTSASCMQGKYQNQLEIMIKLIEIQRLLENYQNELNNKINHAQVLYAMSVDTQHENKNQDLNKNLESIFESRELKNLNQEQLELLKEFMHEIKNKNPEELINIITEYNKKISDKFSNEQKNIIIKFLFDNLSCESQEKVAKFLT